MHHQGMKKNEVIVTSQNISEFSLQEILQYFNISVIVPAAKKEEEFDVTGKILITKYQFQIFTGNLFIQGRFEGDKEKTVHVRANMELGFGYININNKLEYYLQFKKVKTIGLPTKKFSNVIVETEN